MVIKRARDYLAMILISIIFYIPMFIRTANFPFLGNDSYYFLNYIFYNTPLQVSSFVQEFVFGLFPANILIIKLVMLVITIACLFLIYETANLIKRNSGLLSSLFFLNFFWFSWIFMKFEDDLIGLPFILISLYFLIRYVYSENNKKYLDWNIILSLGFLFIGIMIWNFAIYFLIAFAIISNFHRLYILSLVPLIFFTQRLISGILPSLVISENQPITAGIFLLFVGFLYLKNYRLRQTWIAVLVFSALTFVNAKFLFIIIPILVLNFVNVGLKHNLKLRNGVVFILCLFFVIAMYQNLITYPTNKEYQLISIAQQVSLDTNKEVYYQWSVGYFAIWHKLDAKDFGTPPSTETDYKNKIILTVNNDKKIKSCEIIKKSKWLSLAEC